MCRNTCSKTERSNCMQLSKPLRKREYKYPTRLWLELKKKINLWPSHWVCTTDQRQGPFSLLCIWVVAWWWVKRLLVAVVPQETPRIGTFFTFLKNVLSDKAPSVPRVLKSRKKKAEAAEKGRGECYMPRVISQNSQLKKTWPRSKGMKGTTRCTSLSHGRTLKKDPLLWNISWHSSSRGVYMFCHKGSWKTSSSVRILAEFGTLQGPGLRDPLGLLEDPGILFVEATKSSLELDDLPFCSFLSVCESFLLHMSLKNDKESLLLVVPLLVFLSSASLIFPLTSLCSEFLLPRPSLSFTGNNLWGWESPATLRLKLSFSTLGLSPLPIVYLRMSRFSLSLVFCSMTWVSLLEESFNLLWWPCCCPARCIVETTRGPAWALSNLMGCIFELLVGDILLLLTAAPCAWLLVILELGSCSLALGNVSPVFFGLLSSLESFVDAVLLWNFVWSWERGESLSTFFSAHSSLSSNEPRPLLWRGSWTCWELVLQLRECFSLLEKVGERKTEALAGCGEGWGDVSEKNTSSDFLVGEMIFWGRWSATEAHMFSWVHRNTTQNSDLRMGRREIMRYF